MNVFDLVILAILAALTLRGIWKGMVSQIVSVASYFVCWIAATRFGGLIAPTIPVEAPWNQVLAMAIIFLITLVAIRFATAALEKLIKDWHLQKLNTLLGGILGFTKGILLCLIITFFAVMLSETSRAVVFNSKSGFHLVRLIAQIGMFVPKDSYEFVHTQFEKFQEKIDAADSEQPPETLKVQSSETLQRMVSQLKQADENSETGAGSLWTALSKWWSGSKDEQKTETETKTNTDSSQPTQKSTSSSLPAATYTPPPPSLLPQVSAYPAVPQPAAPKQTLAAEEFFVQRPDSGRTDSGMSSTSLPQLTALSPSVPPSVSEGAGALKNLAPLTEVLSMLPESAQLLPAMPAPHHVGSDLILRNSMLSATPSASAKVFRP